MRDTFTCSHCGERHSAEERTVFGGQALCPDCLSKHTATCTHCGARIWIGDNAGTEDMPLCQHCYDDYYETCIRCGALIRRDDAYYEDDDDDEEDPLCHHCYCSTKRSIQNYYYKPTPIFYGEGDRYFGVELEIDGAGERGSAADQLMDIANGNHLEHLYCKHDGSLEDGFELVTHARYIMGHTRMTTQGSEHRNQNNHPFPGKAGKLPFALAHNGVLYNDAELRQRHKLPQSKIETDSYVAVQLLEKEGDLSDHSLQRMAEALDGSFTITILDAKNNLYFIKGNNPLTILLLPNMGCYLYASTEEILYIALETLGMADVNAAAINISPGDIMRIDAKGQRSVTHFDTSKLYHSQYSFWPYYGGSCTDRILANLDPFDQMYLEDLKSVAPYYGYTPESIGRLARQGFLPEEIEELLYEGVGVM